MSKHYNLTVTDDNGKSVTTSNTSTEHSDEILRMMHLAGMQDASCGCDESIEENEYQPTPANDKLDLDDYSKKSGESIPKQKKSLDKAPSRGDNPLEYSLDENEIFESLMNEFEEVEEGKLNPGLQAYIDKKKGKKDDKEDKEDKVEEKKAKPDFADIDGDGDTDFIGTRGNSAELDGVFWLEQVRSREPLRAFTPARQNDSRAMALP